MEYLRTRLNNVFNRYQGKRARVLCVCTAGLIRSPVISRILDHEPYNCNTRAVGYDSNYALIVLDIYLLEWCEVIVCADFESFEKVKEILEKFDMEEKKVIHLGIPDIYDGDSAELVECVHLALKSHNFGLILDEVLAKRHEFD